MKILIYIEPHPIRNSYISFNNVAESFTKIASTTSADIKVFLNKETFTHIKRGIHDEHLFKYIFPTSTEEKILKKYNTNWYEEGIENWMSLLEGGQIADDYLNILHRIWNEFPFDVIIYWGENGAITRFADEMSLTKISMELGCTRAPFLDSVVMDMCGSNGNGIVPKISIDDIRKIVDNKYLSSAESLYQYSNDPQVSPFKNQFSPIPDNVATCIIKNKDKFVFFPLQLYDDANILFFSKYKAIKDIVQDVIPRIVDNGYKVILKPHPAYKMREMCNFEYSLAKLETNKFKDSVIWCDVDSKSHYTQSLIKKADFIVTVNSSVGFESLYYDKIIVPLGVASYTPKGFFPTLEELFSQDFDKQKYLRDIGYLRRFFLGSYLINKDVFSDVQLFLHRVAICDNLRKAHGTNFKRLAGEYYKFFSTLHKNVGNKTEIFSLTQNIKNNVCASQQEYQPAIKQNIVSQVTKLIHRSQADNYNSFCSWLKLQWNSKQDREKIISALGIFDAKFYLAKYPDVASSGIKPLDHFVKYGIFENRVPSNTTPFERTSELPNALAEYAKDLFDSNILSKLCTECKGHSKEYFELPDFKTNNKICVVTHLYYKDLVPELLQYLNNISEEFDLFVSVPDWGSDDIVSCVLKQYPNAIISAIYNRGRDIAPFINFLPFILKNNYELVLKIHTKRGFFKSEKFIPEKGDLWRKICLESLLGSSSSVTKIVQTFRENHNVSMIGPELCYLSVLHEPYSSDGFALANSLIHENLNHTGFFAGTMFWARPACFKPLIQKLSLSMADFEEGYGANENLLANDIERLFGALALEDGCLIETCTDACSDLCLLDIDLMSKPLSERIDRYFSRGI